MGTNYYIRDHCSSCGDILKYEAQHIGKSSFGWKFCFNATELKNKEDWLKQLEINKDYIFDEYGRSSSLEEFKEMLEAKAIGHHQIDGGEYVQDGCRFYPGEFL